jgi:3-dehydroquinate synthase
MKSLTVNYAITSQYDVLIERGIFKTCGKLIHDYAEEKEYFIITVPPVKKFWYKILTEQFTKKGLKLFCKTIKDGERSKCQEVVADILKFLSHNKAHRNSVLIGLGGGVVGDITGYCASIYMRGIRYIHIPTSLIAQTDSSIGGKTGINTGFGKNLVGTFYQPEAVFIDPDLLSTLPEEEYSNGLGEVVKYGILDKEIFHFIEHNKEKIKKRDAGCVSTMIELCCKFKVTTVNHDLLDKNERAFLNLGHTVGHALERITRYRYYKHGEAVALGIVAACSLSFQRKLLKTDDMKRILYLMDYFRLLKPLPDFSIDDLIAIMHNDKKRISSLFTFVLPTGIGSVTMVSDVDVKKERGQSPKERGQSPIFSVKK